MMQLIKRSLLIQNEHGDYFATFYTYAFKQIME